MTPGIALIIIAAILIKAGWKNQNIVDVALGRDTRNPDGNVDGGDPGTVTGGTGAAVVGAPSGTTLIDGKPVASWIVPYVRFARSHGWNGVVTSGYRSNALQSSLYNDLLAGRRRGPVAEPGKSNHNYIVFPRGAIDVSDPDGFQRALNQFVGPVPLRRDPTIGDPVHFSVTGR